MICAVVTDPAACQLRTAHEVVVHAVRGSRRWSQLLPGGGGAGQENLR